MQEIQTYPPPLVLEEITTTIPPEQAQKTALPPPTETEQENVTPTPIPTTYVETIRPENIYLQLGAFEQAANAQILQSYWTGQTRYPVYLATFPDATPHKVVLGPFPNWDAARLFRQQHQVAAFPRAASFYHSILF